MNYIYSEIFIQQKMRIFYKNSKTIIYIFERTVEKKQKNPYLLKKYSKMHLKNVNI